MIFNYQMILNQLDLHFKCCFQHNELNVLQKNLPVEEFCIVNVPAENTFYGVMNDELHGKFLDILSGETLGQFEYVDEKDFRDLNYTDVIGNEELIKNLSS